MKAVIDRFEGDYAVKHIVPAELQVDILRRLQPEGCKEGDWFNVIFELDQEEKEERKARIQHKMEMLKKRSKENQRVARIDFVLKGLLVALL